MARRRTNHSPRNRYAGMVNKPAKKSHKKLAKAILEGEHSEAAREAALNKPLELDISVPKPFPWQRKFEQALHDPKVRFIVIPMGRRAGKTLGTARVIGKASLGGFGIPTGLSFFWGSHSQDNSRMGRRTFEGPVQTSAWGSFERYSMFGPAIQINTKVPNEVVMYGGSRIRWRSLEGHAAALGHGNFLNVIDEAARCSELVINEEVLPTMADVPFSKTVAISTPRGKQSWFYKWYCRAMDGDPQYKAFHGSSLENPSPAIKEFVKIAEKNMPEDLFRQEFHAEFVDGAGSVFRYIEERARLDDYRDHFEGNPDEDLYVIGADLGKHNDYTVLYAMHAYSGEVHGKFRRRHLDWTSIKQCIADFSKGWNDAPIYLDSTGLGDPIFDDLANDGLPVESFKFSNESKSQLVIALMTAMDKNEIAYPKKDENLKYELGNFSYEQLPSGKFRYSAPEGEHDDCVIALGLANWGRVQSTWGMTGAAMSSVGWLNVSVN